MGEYDIEHSIQLLKFADKIIGLTETVTINSGIYEHADFNTTKEEEEMDSGKDFIKIRGSARNPITMNDIVAAYEKIMKQSIKISKSSSGGRTYFYEGIKYNPRSKTWDILWCT